MHVALALMTGNRTFAGGVPAVVWQRARYLRQQGHDVSIVCSSHGEWRSPELRSGIHIYPVRPPIGRLDSWFARRLATRCPLYLRSLSNGLDRAHSRLPLDLVDLQDGPGILGAARFCRRRGLPMSFTIHGSAALNPAPRPAAGRALHIRYEAAAWARAAVVLPVSRYISTAGRRFGNFDSKVRIVPNTVQDAWLRAGRGRTLDVQAGPLRLLFLARIAAEKRLETALDAMARLEAGVAVLDVVGGGELEAPMRRRAQELGLDNRVRFHGFLSERTDVERRLLAADAFVFPTEFEAMSVALLEAMAFGLYPVASDIPSNAEILPDSYLVPLGDAEAMAARVRTAAEDRDRIRSARTELFEIASRFRPELVYPGLEEAYRDAAA